MHDITEAAGWRDRTASPCVRAGSSFKEPRGDPATRSFGVESPWHGCAYIHEITASIAFVWDRYCQLRHSKARSFVALANECGSWSTVQGVADSNRKLQVVGPPGLPEA